ncbi:hypothetical protein TSUD_250180 [Trifolium subterraneum]|nr:hypothetical protein TSUD_250180 [Trifolium subterraneum]
MPRLNASHHDSSALLQFKNSFFVNTSSIPNTNWDLSSCSSFSFKTETWSNNTDCCEWNGVTCDTISDYVIGLDLSCNNLKGGLHPNSTIFQLRHLQKLNLAFNDFSWSPMHVGIGDLVSLTHLNLSNCYLSGNVSSTISHLSKLVSLDLSRNWMELKLNPFTWKKLIHNATNLKELYLDGVDMSSIRESSLSMLKNLSSSLVSLSLSSTELQGSLSSDILSLPNLQKLDLSYNENLSGQLPKSNWSTALSGPLPTSCIDNFQGMMNLDDSQNGLRYMDQRMFYTDSQYYNDSVVVMMKGFSMELTKILTTFTTIDLSNNMFEGEIPKCIGELNSLKGLNLSNNGIIGNIPQSLSHLKKLEWLDLSRNKLTGEIPMALTNLNFLSFLNLSQNHLEGMIPKGQQFDTFGNESYEGNAMLCGFSLSKSCKKDKDWPPHSTSEDEEESGFGWKAVAIGYACGAIFGLLLGYIVFFVGKPQWIVRHVEHIFNIRLM